MTTTTARKPFTKTTWASISADQAYLSRDYANTTRVGWEGTCDLSYELVELHPYLSIESARALTDLCVSQIPVILTWQTELGGDLGVERQTNAVIVEYMSAQQIYIRYCGFGHWVALDQVVGAESFKAIVSYSNSI